MRTAIYCQRVFQAPMKVSCLVIGILAWCTSAPVLACGPRTLEIVKMMEAATEPPVFACGSDFNELLKQAHLKNWPAALAAYEAHLKGIGRSEANTPEAADTLAFLKVKAGAGK